MDERRRRFEAQVLPYLDAAYRFARWLARSPADAEDVVQEAMLRAYRGFDGLRGSDVKAWLLTIVRNCHSTALRQQHQRGVMVSLPEEDDSGAIPDLVATGLEPEGESIRRDEQLTLEGLIAALPHDYREVLVLREIEELSYREIAEATQVPIGTVMSRLARARLVLKKQWSAQAEGSLHAVP